jgi:hypothetical protein
MRGHRVLVRAVGSLFTGESGSVGSRIHVICTEIAFRSWWKKRERHKGAWQLLLPLLASRCLVPQPVLYRCVRCNFTVNSAPADTRFWQRGLANSSTPTNQRSGSRAERGCKSTLGAFVDVISRRRRLPSQLGLCAGPHTAAAPSDEGDLLPLPAAPAAPVGRGERS